MKLDRIILFSVVFLPAFSNLEFNKNNADFIKLLKDTTITVVAPASGVEDKELLDLNTIDSFKLHIPNNCLDRRKALFHSHNDAIRFKCLKEALQNDGNKVIWALRGGYGSAKLIDELEQLSKPKREKFFIGYSDITALHLFLTEKWEWKTIHGSMIVELLNRGKDRQNFVKIAEIISGEVDKAIIKGLLPINAVAQSSKIVSGKLTGGNLTIVQTSIGTAWQIKTSGKILFLEDPDALHRIDRALYHLKQAGLLDHVHAIVFGSIGDNRDKRASMTLLKDFANTLKVPVFKTDRFGHGAVNDPIIYNTDAQLMLSDNIKFDLIMKL